MKRRMKAKRRYRRQPGKPIGPADVSVVANGPVADSYETDVAPDLIDAGRTPDRSKAPDSECSLPPENGPGRACP